MSKWHSGSPPSKGWWIASAMDDEACLRWWDGIAWSKPAYEGYTAADVALFGAFKTSCVSPIKWQHRPKSWPARSKT